MIPDFITLGNTLVWLFNRFRRLVFVLIALLGIVGVVIFVLILGG